MNKNLKTWALAIILAISGLLVACDDNSVSVSQARQMADKAKSDATAAEAAKADAKLATARQELVKIGTDTARQGGFNSAANCNITPDSVHTSSAAKNFPTFAVSMYRDSCIKEVTVMNAERRANSDRAVARAKANELKLAARRAKAEQVARAKAAEAKRLAAKPAKSRAKLAATR